MALKLNSEKRERCRLQASVTPNDTRVPPTAQLPALATVSSNGVGQCNTDVPNMSPLQRFQFICGFLASNGLYVVRCGAWLMEKCYG
jgi:hypothetical protein